MILFKLKASSLTNTIFVCLIISIFCSCLVLVAHYSKVINDYLELQEDLVLHNESALYYALQTLEQYNYGSEHEINVLDSEIKTVVTRKDWGFYHILTCKSMFKNDTIIKSVLVGADSQNNNLSLYVTNYDIPIKVGGKTSIVGDKKVPLGTFANAHISQDRELLNKGRTMPSNERLPSLAREIKPWMDDNVLLDVNFEKDITIFNEFDQPTKTLNLDRVPVLEDITLKGNIIVRSNTNLTIKNTAHLEDIILITNKKLTIEEGFKGSMQIIANEDIDINPKVTLQYPSSIYIKNDVDSIQVKISKHSKLLGGIVISGDSYEGSLKRHLIMEDDAMVVGSIYNYGYTQLKGTVIGEVYTDRLYNESNDTNSENTIINAVVDHDSLPKNFIKLPLFNSKDLINKYHVIKTF